MNEPLVSIVIPAYNHAAYVSEAVKSVLAQDYPRLELIVIDDGSSDNTAEILTCLGPGFRWESQVNMGQSRTLTRGWELAQGELLAYLSADDVLEPRAVSAAVTAFQADPEAVATYCDFCLIDPNSRVIRRVRVPDYSYAELLGQVSCPIGPGAFFKRSAYAQSGPWNPAYRQMPDYDFWLRLGLHGRFVRIPQVLAGFRVHENSQTYAQTSPERAAEPVEIVTKVIESSAAAALNPELKRRALANAHLVSAQLHLRAGRVASASQNVCRALRYSTSTTIAPRSFRLLINAAVNRSAHRLLWTIRGMMMRLRK